MRPGYLPWFVWMVVLCGVPGAYAATVTAVPLAPPAAGRTAEWRVEGVPPATNVFDPDVIAVDGIFTDPAGNIRSIPAFWYRPYQRSLQNGRESLTPSGPGEWRLRYFPFAEGTYSLRIDVSTTGAPLVHGSVEAFDVQPSEAPSKGFPKVSSDRRFFETSDGEPLPLVGANVCWHGQRGTSDYDDWFPAMASSGWNWARLWMAPWAFGIEAAPGDRLQYRLDHAWQLDHTFELAESQGLYLLLCFDYHGMFETEPDIWGGNNLWPAHPYNAAHGGPCRNQREFFTLASARTLYQKRLRYIIGRYGASPALFGWEFFNEIDNVYRHLNAAEVADWHAYMGAWLKAHDPWGHPITTSLTGSSDRPEIWTLPELDFANYHSYGEPAPAQRLGSVVESMFQRYQKPVLVAEAGVDARGWARASDPFLRGFRQLLWGGLMAGSAGTSMSWWWESLHGENVYPCYRALTNILAGTHWGQGNWEPLVFSAPAPTPTRVADVIPGGLPFEVQLTPDGSWGSRPAGKLAIADPLDSAEAPKRLNSFIHGSAHTELRMPFQLDAWFGMEGKLVMHLNSVSSGAILAVRVDGSEVFRRVLPDKDGTYNVNNEYNEDIEVPIPANHRLVEIRNVGSDWLYLDWVRLEGVLPATYADDWSPFSSVTGIHRAGEALVYVVAPRLEYPSQATNQALPTVTNATLTVSNLPAGDYAAVWFNPTNGTEAGRTQARTREDGTLRLAVPPFKEDVCGQIFSPPTLRAEGMNPTGAFSIRIQGVRTELFSVEATDDWRGWTTVGQITSENSEGDARRWTDAGARSEPRRFYRLRLEPF